MYKIIGANQAEYGPVTADQLRQWIAEGRVHAQTLAQAEGETTWRPISTFPEFAASFPAAAPTPPPGVRPAAPSPSLGAEGGRAAALDYVSGPGIGLIITGALEVLYALYGIVNYLFVGSLALQQQLSSMPGQNPQALKFVQFVTGPAAIGINIVLIAIAVFVIFSGVKMRRLENYGLCMTGAIIAMIPCCTSCCCIVGLPIGIWALVMLNKPEVRANFH